MPKSTGDVIPTRPWTYVVCKTAPCNTLHDHGLGREGAAGKALAKCPDCDCVGEEVTMDVQLGSIGPSLVQYPAAQPDEPAPAKTSKKKSGS